MSRFLSKAVVVLSFVAATASLPLASQAAPIIARPAVQPGNIKLQALPPDFSEARVRAHVIVPPNIKGIESEDVKEPGLVVNTELLKKFKKVPHLDIDAFGKALHASLKDSVNGYTMQMRKNGNLVYTLQWNWARKPADGGKGWNPDVRMHIASVSKFLTAVGMVKTLDAKGISLDAKIAPYLPTYWTKGPKIDQITFRNLLTHTSGFSTGGSSSDFNFMKGRVAMGVPAVGGYDYENMNFGLCRILIPVINGNIDKDATFFGGFLNDSAWDAITLSHFTKYMQDKVFTPSGVSNVSYEPLPNKPGALAYEYKNSPANGWDSGNLITMAGGAGFRLSVKELLNVMDNVRRRNTVISKTRAQYMLDNYLGIDQAIDTPAGKTYNKNGLWRSNGRTEQDVAFFLPQNLEVVVFVNSKIGSGDGASLRGTVETCYENALVE